IENAVGVQQTFALQLETDRGKLSEISKATTMTPVDVPGVVRDLGAIVDQHRIALQWQRPEKNADLAKAYVVSREKPPDSHVVNETHYEDANFETGKKYSYTVVAARDATGSVLGIPASAFSIDAVDKRPPAAPSGMHIDVAGNAAILTWEA